MKVGDRVRYVGTFSPSLRGATGTIQDNGMDAVTVNWDGGLWPRVVYRGNVSVGSVPSASDNRTANNAVRHNYRVLSEAEKAQMVSLKDMGAAFLTACDDCGSSRELSIAKTKMEEAVMWAVKHVTL